MGKAGMAARFVMTRRANTSECFLKKVLDLHCFKICWSRARPIGNDTIAVVPIHDITR